MISTIQKPTLKGLLNGNYLLPILIGVISILAAYPILSRYLIPSITWVFHCFLVVLSIQVVHIGRYSQRYGWLALILLVVFTFLKIKVLYQMGLCLSLLGLIEMHRGRINYPPIFGIFLLTPFSQYFFNIFSFPIRLKLTKFAAQSLALIKSNVEASGNVIQYDGIDFTVSEVCMGLNFFQTGLIISLFLIAYFEKARKQYMSLWQVGGWLAVTLLLVIFTNFLRIITIVLFKALPGTFEHELIGLACFVVYVGLPIFAGLKWLGSYKYEFKNSIQKNSVAVLPILTMLFFSYSGFFPDQFFPKPKELSQELLHREGYEQKQFRDKIIQFSNDSALIYVKPGVPFYAAEHSSSVCWRGSGYETSKEMEGKVNGQPVIFAELETPEDGKLYSCWWFNNGIRQTTSQIVWRKAMIQGEPAFQLINVICADRKTLEKEALKWIK